MNESDWSMSIDTTENGSSKLSSKMFCCYHDATQAGLKRQFASRSQLRSLAPSQERWKRRSLKTAREPDLLSLRNWKKTERHTSQPHSWHNPPTETRKSSGWTTSTDKRELQTLVWGDKGSSYIFKIYHGNIKYDGSRRIWLSANSRIGNARTKEISPSCELRITLLEMFPW